MRSGAVRAREVRRLGGALAACAAALGSAPGAALAAGFHIDEQDARATGRGGAITASTNNASAIYYNPGGLPLLQGLHVDLGASVVSPSADFTSAESGVRTEADSQVFVLPQAYVGWRADDLVALGVGFNAPYGLALTWPASSPGRAEVREAELRTFFITPAFGLNLSRWVPGLGVGGGIDLVPASVRLSRDIPFGSEVGSVVLGGNTFGVGARIGVLYRPEALRAWAFGLTWRTPVRLDFSGNGDFDAPAALRGSLPPDGEVATSVTLPHSLSLGVQFSPVPELELELDGNLRGWSSYDRLDIELPDGSVDRSAKNWKDAFAVRLGGEYTFAERWAVRLGAIWDQTPIPPEHLAFELPDATRIDVTAGFGARLSEQVQLDLAFLYVFPKDRETAMDDPLEPPVKGTFGIEAWLVGLSLGLSFDTPPKRSEPEALAGAAECLDVAAAAPGCQR